MPPLDSGEPGKRFSPEPTFDPLAPIDPSLTIEVDVWFLAQAKEEYRQLAASVGATSLHSPYRRLGGRSNLRRLALQGEIAGLEARLRQGRTTINESSNSGNVKEELMEHGMNEAING